MRRNRKSDNERFTLFEDGTLHLYDVLVEVETEEGVQYEGDLYVLKSTIQENEIEIHHQLLVSMLAECEKQGVDVQHTAELPSAYLRATDWVDIQLARTERLHGRESEEYTQLFNKRKPVLENRERATRLVGVLR